MKNFFSKEIIFFNYYLNLKTLPISKEIVLKNKDKGSINNLCENFIIRLQSQFPSTIHTILRSSEKIKIEIVENQLLCFLCQHELTLNEIHDNICYSCQIQLIQNNKLKKPLFNLKNELKEFLIEEEEEEIKGEENRNEIKE